MVLVVGYTGICKIYGCKEYWFENISENIPGYNETNDGQHRIVQNCHCFRCLFFIKEKQDNLAPVEWRYGKQVKNKQNKIQRKGNTDNGGYCIEITSTRNRSDM